MRRVTGDTARPGYDRQAVSPRAHAMFTLCQSCPPAGDFDSVRNGPARNVHSAFRPSPRADKTARCLEQRKRLRRCCECKAAVRCLFEGPLPLAPTSCCLSHGAHSRPRRPTTIHKISTSLQSRGSTGNLSARKANPLLDVPFVGMSQLSTSDCNEPTVSIRWPAPTAASLILGHPLRHGADQDHTDPRGGAPPIPASTPPRGQALRHCEPACSRMRRQ